MTAIQPRPLVSQPMPQADSHAPIGIFDSGIGGLSVVQEIAQYLPNERIIYFADTAHVPYGPRSGQDIRELTAHAIEWLYRQGCKAIVVACNTASAFSLDYLREHYGENFPIIGLVPALKPAVLQTKSKVVAVLATPATFRGQLIKDVMQHFAEPAGVKVLPVTCLELVPLIEAGQQMSAHCLDVLRECLSPVAEQGADYLVLGCTHYPFLTEAIQQVFGNQFKLVDSGLAVARQTARVLIKHGLVNNQPMSGTQIVCYASGGNTPQLHRVVERLMPLHLQWEIANLAL
ncbi:glutamate racemase [Acinetobacter sp. MB5]|uniref:glutamate racemase n=1 Tax=Acinetobacter sp. MB5 TaxID=2069438 RepID=UPI000DCFF114|nr:glutamate racemase [Acinetobacter sp. MB5]